VLVREDLYKSIAEFRQSDGHVEEGLKVWSGIMRSHFWSREGFYRRRYFGKSRGRLLWPAFGHGEIMSDNIF
jgi:hypothetical protein